jgi:hypothetical protein
VESEEPKLYSDTIDPVRRANPDELFFLILEARPEPGAEDFGSVGGAAVSCWVNADDLRSAELRAVALIEGHGWRPHRFDSWKIVNRETYADGEVASGDEPDGPELRGLAEQAFIDGEVCVFYTWPPDANDAEDDPSRSTA